MDGTARDRVARCGDPNGTELIFNPRTYQLMGVGLSAAESISTGPILGTRSIAFLHTAVVNSAPRPLVRNGAQAAGSWQVRPGPPPRTSMGGRPGLRGRRDGQDRGHGGTQQPDLAAPV
jgi:hypothetical protein